MENVNNRGQISCNGIVISFEVGHTLQEWNEKYGNRDTYTDIAFWDVSIEDLLNGGIEPQEGMIYWLIDGRMYETMQQEEEQPKPSKSIEEMEREFKEKVYERLAELYHRNKEEGLFGAIDMRETIDGNINYTPSCAATIQGMWKVVVEKYLSDPNKVFFDGEFFYNEEDGSGAYTIDAGFHYNGENLTIY